MSYNHLNPKHRVLDETLTVLKISALEQNTQPLLIGGYNVPQKESPALQSVKGRRKGGDGVDGATNLIMATDALVCGSTIGDGRGSGWEVDGHLALNRIIAALYPKVPR
ncbi:hypothetical protein Tco_0339166 [Tanacetum coccineum]